MRGSFFANSMVTHSSPNPPLPITPTCIPLFISYLSFRKLACSTTISYLSAISYVHKIKHFNDPTKSYLFEKLLTALSRQQPSDIHLSITRPILPQLIFSVTFSNSSLFQGCFLSHFTVFFSCVNWPPRAHNLRVLSFSIVI